MKLDQIFEESIPLLLKNPKVNKLDKKLKKLTKGKYGIGYIGVGGHSCPNVDSSGDASAGDTGGGDGGGGD